MTSHEMIDIQEDGPVDKAQETLVEDVDKREQHALRIMPESLRGLSESEMRQLEKGMVRRMDLIILQVV